MNEDWRAYVEILVRHWHKLNGQILLFSTKYYFFGFYWYENAYSGICHGLKWAFDHFNTKEIIHCAFFMTCMFCKVWSALWGFGLFPQKVAQLCRTTQGHTDLHRVRHRVCTVRTRHNLCAQDIAWHRLQSAAGLALPSLAAAEEPTSKLTGSESVYKREGQMPWAKSWWLVLVIQQA